MGSHRWMDVDGTWVYSAAPRRHPDSQMNYSTFPDSTNWTPSPPAGARGPKMGRINQQTRGSDEGIYEDVNKIAMKSAGEKERKKRKMLREAQANLGNVSSAKLRLKGKHREENPVYGGWEFDYVQEQKMKAAKYDDWEPLACPPKALQSQLMSQTPKMRLNQSQPQSAIAMLTESNAGSQAQEKKRWWSKSQKQLRSGQSDVGTTVECPEGTNNTYVEQSSLTINEIHKQQRSKENHPYHKKRLVPPPYVPPPSYNSPHRTFPASKNKNINTTESDRKAMGEILPSTGQENAHKGEDKVPKYSEGHMSNSYLTYPSFTSLKSDRQGAKKKHRHDVQDYQNSISDRKLPPTYSTWGGLPSQGNQPTLQANEFLDHIYEIVDGGSFPVTPNVANVPQKIGLQIGEMTYGTITVPQQTDAPTQNTLPSRGGKAFGLGNRLTKITKKNKNIINGDQRQSLPFDALRPPIPSYGVKLPRESRLSYLSEKGQYANKRDRLDYTNYEGTDNEELGSEWRRPLRAISSKEARTQGQSTSISSKGVYGWYSHTLPWKNNAHDRMNTDVHGKMVSVHSSKQRMSSKDTNFPKWREPAKVSTLPGKGYDRHWRQHDNLKPSVKYNISELPKPQDGLTNKKHQLKENIPEKLQPSSSKESDGLFVIDATCVLVRAEYIFPPRKEQVQFLTDTERVTKADNLSLQAHFTDHVIDRSTQPFSSQCTSASENTVNKYQYRTRCAAMSEEADPPSTEGEVPNLQKRAERILGLSVVELDSVNKITGQQEPAEESVIGGVNVSQGPSTEEKKPELPKETNQECIEVKGDTAEDVYCNMIVDVHAASLQLAGNNEQASNQTTLDFGDTEENRDLRSEQNMLFCPAQEIITEGSGHKSSRLERQSIELCGNKGSTESNPDNEHCLVLNYNSFAKLKVETSLEKQSESNEGNTAKTASSCGEHDPDLKKKQKLMNEQLLDTKPVLSNTAAMSREKTSIISETYASERSEQKGYAFSENSKAECVHTKETKCNISYEHVYGKKISAMKGNVDHLPGTLQNMTKKNWVGQNRTLVELAENVEPDPQCLEQSRKTSKGLSLPTDQPHLPFKANARRQNYFAKDLREAVSRIRRHTAPDSDTDEDLEKPLPDTSSGGYGVLVGEDARTSYSSDTSDSEVTVIMCDTETVQISKAEVNDSPPNFMEDGAALSNETETTKNSALEESTLEALQPDVIGDQPNNPQIHANQQEESVLDLNSCIEEILQDLTRTEQEFFPSTNESSSALMTTYILDYSAASEK
ncbi:dendrin [Rhinophrynus dorsalis]